MESYQTWFGEGPELSVLRMLGLFDRPVTKRRLESCSNHLLSWALLSH